MADQASFPQIPTGVWWGVRAILARNPRTKFDETTLSVQLNVQVAAARQYLAELKRLGVLTDEGNATEVGLRWRVDDTYRSATDELMTIAYPQQLLDLAPSDSADRSQVERWFIAQGLGQGTARNKAGTYMLLANGEPGASMPSRQNNSQASQTRPPRVTSEKAKPKPAEKVTPPPTGTPKASDVMPLNVNVQIHISADASSDQIETIFSSMRKYLHGDVAA